MPATLTPPAPGEVAAPKDSSVSSVIDKFKNRMAADDKPAAKPPEQPAAIKPIAPPPPAPEPPKPIEPKTVVPKLEPLPEKKSEVPPEKPAAAADELKSPGAKNFKIVTAERDEFRNKYEAADKRAKELENKLQEQNTRTPPELEETQKLLAEKDHFIKQFMLEQSEEFQNAFTRPIEQAIQDAKDVVGGEKGERLADILKAPDGKWRTDRLKEFVGELEDDYEKGVVRDAASTLRKLERTRRDELQKAGTNVQALKQLHAKRAEEQAAQQKEMRSKLVQVSLNEASRSLMEFRETDDAAHNVAVAENKMMLQNFLTDDLPPEQLGRMAAWAVRGYRSLGVEKQLTEKIAMLESEIAKLSSASPDLDSGGSSQPNGDKANTPEKAGERFLRATRDGVPGR